MKFSLLLFSLFIYVSCTSSSSRSLKESRDKVSPSSQEGVDTTKINKSTEVIKKDLSGIALVTVTPIPTIHPTFIKLVSPHSKDNPLHVDDWLAMGSGCKMSRMTAPGEVSFEFFRSQQDSNVYQGVFLLPSFKLDGDKPINAARPTFARECGMRISLFPGKDKKLTGVRIFTSINSKKAEKVTLKMWSRFLLAAVDVGTWQKDYELGTYHDNRIDRVELLPNQEGREILGALSCGQPKLVGVDLSLLALRSAFTDKVMAEVATDKKVFFEFTIAECK